MTGLSRLHGSGRGEAITVAQDIIGPAIMARLEHVQFVCGVDPVFAGIHGYEVTEDGRSYRDTACCVYPIHMTRHADARVTTIVVPHLDRSTWGPIHTIVHEYGHALHEAIDFEHDATPVSEYAKLNRWEAFAEAFTAWCWPGIPGYHRRDDRDAALFRTIAAS